MNNISEKVLAKIEAEHITPAAKWHFIAKRCMFWLLASLSIVFGIISTSVILNIMENSDWDAYNRIELVFMAVPYLWLAIFAAFIISAYYNFRHSKRGYHYSFLLIIGVTLLFSIIGGIIVYQVGWGEEIHESLIVRVHPYERAFDTRMMAWQNPRMGLLAGRVGEVRPHDFGLEDFSGHQWQVVYTENTIIGPRVLLATGERVKLMGVPGADFVFEAHEIRSWQPRKKNSPPAYYLPKPKSAPARIMPLPEGHQPY